VPAIDVLPSSILIPLKFVAVAPQFRESTAFAQIVTHLSSIVLNCHKHTFVFTKPDTATLFKGLGYKEIASSPPLFTVLEFGYESIDDYLKYLQTIKRPTNTDEIASIVVNCNPFTKGHQYLIEKAACENELVYVFVVEEERSAFNFALRWKLIENGISHLKNVVMVKGGQYIVSGAIFPSYFLKNESYSAIIEKQAELDIIVFAKYMIPALNIKKRYVGTEQYCATTAAYNSAMKKILPEHNVQLIEIKRISADNSDNFISASKIRDAIRNNTLNTVLNFLPESTKQFLLSEEAQEICSKIRNSDNRH